MQRRRHRATSRQGEGRTTLADTIATFLLAAITAVYVALTWKLLAATVAANQQNKELAWEGHRLQMYPQLFCFAEASGDTTTLVLQNLGSAASGDLDVLVMSSYWDEDTPVGQFLAENASDPSSITLTSSDFGLFGVYNRFLYASFPARRQVRVPLGFPAGHDNINVLLQFRDALGNNYSRVYWMFLSSPSDKRYRIGSLEPNCAETSSRIASYEYAKGKLTLSTSDKESLPPALKGSDLLHLLEHCVPLGKLRGSPGDVEEPGEWADA